MKPKIFSHGVLISLMLVLLTILLSGFLVVRNFQKWHLVILPMQPRNVSPNNVTRFLGDLTTATISSVNEIAVLVSPRHTDAIVRLAQEEKSNFIVAIYADGETVHWDLASQQIQSESNIGVVNWSTAYISFDGTRAISAGEITDDGINGVSVWDLETSKLVLCDGDHCPTPYPAPYIRGIYLDPKGIFQIDIDETLIGFTPIENGKLPVMVYHYNDRCVANDAETYPPILRIAIDPSDTYIALVLGNGRVCVRELKTILGFDPVTGERIPRLENYKYNRYGIANNASVRDLALDPTNRWLAVLTDNELYVWNLGAVLFPSEINTPIEDGNVFAFDNTGQILALGTQNGIEIYDTENGKKIFSFKTEEVTAINFSLDNRLLIWGDVRGGVHIWGVSD